ncbi:peptide ABC transporter substrate-binding protein [Brunnivagina elsteri]|uniref:Peptide ABC transporter substrate-binding protein n=1 Tax=Brunnivagina elsteri CCALA 953 TaxID=987040 RepID=A0A2A2TEJ8_9CYAN|nr:peptide ABC transporter substrate-binding protein [Calothrix elsteri]PAX52055.1 peptide ABC transporter substrate-binding protein [Calothrix elsteri CCALA 953]
MVTYNRYAGTGIKKLLTERELKEARDWLVDCAFADVDADDIYYKMDETEIARAIRQHYDGGVEAFRQSVSAK